MIYILSGDIGVGKSHSLLEWVRYRTDVFGVLSLRMVYEDRYFFDIRSKDIFIMEAVENDKNTVSVGRYHFLKSAFKRANNIIRGSLKRNKSGYLIIDEIGKLELRSEGLHTSACSAIKKTLHDKNLHLILVVRTSLLKEITQKYQINQYKLISKDSLPEQLM
jgi:nucleoside-triphosphatase THEP1